VQQGKADQHRRDQHGADAGLAGDFVLPVDFRGCADEVGRVDRRATRFGVGLLDGVLAESYALSERAELVIGEL
jgi:hypothetical protein